MKNFMQKLVKDIFIGFLVGIFTCIFGAIIQGIVRIFKNKKNKD